VKQKNLDFSSLILRLCSLALQCLPENLRQHVEDKLGDNVQFLTERYHNAARKLSDYSELGFGGLIHVQQLFLTAAWLKGEGFFDRAWHSLGAAIREAQELGMLRSKFCVSLVELMGLDKVFTVKSPMNLLARWTGNCEDEYGVVYTSGTGQFIINSWALFEGDYLISVDLCRLLFAVRTLSTTIQMMFIYHLQIWRWIQSNQVSHLLSLSNC